MITLVSIYAISCLHEVQYFLEKRNKLETVDIHNS